MTDKQTEALKLALEALKELRMLGMNAQWHDSWLAKPNEAIIAIREALAEQPAQQQEPVAWVCEASSSDEKHAIDYWPGDVDDLPIGTKLYTSPPASKPWVGLTQQDIDIAFDDTQEGGGFNEFARAIEAKLREKNA